jgi:hypothetical protein
MGTIAGKPNRYFKIKKGYIVQNIKASQEEACRKYIADAEKVVRYTNDNNVDVIDLCYRGIKVYLKSIHMLDWEYDKTVNTMFQFVGEDEGIGFILNIQDDSGNAHNIINSLASVEDFSKPITFKAYEKDGYTRVAVYQDNESLPWKLALTELPPIVEVMTIDPKTGKAKPLMNPKTQKPFRDASERIEVFKKLASDINIKLTGKPMVHYTGTGAKAVSGYDYAEVGADDGADEEIDEGELKF